MIMKKQMKKGQQKYCGFVEKYLSEHGKHVVKPLTASCQHLNNMFTTLSKTGTFPQFHNIGDDVLTLFSVF